MNGIIKREENNIQVKSPGLLLPLTFQFGLVGRIGDLDWQLQRNHNQIRLTFQFHIEQAFQHTHSRRLQLQR